jgi:site-specific DNA-adenine methylase
VEYPTSSGIRSGYVKNVVSLIHYFNPYNWINGKTEEKVFDRPNGNVIGSIDPHEKATILYVDNVTGWTNVVYSTSKGEFTKSGWVEFKGL